MSSKMITVGHSIAYDDDGCMCGKGIEIDRSGYDSVCYLYRKRYYTISRLYLGTMLVHYDSKSINVTRRFVVVGLENYKSGNNKGLPSKAILAPVTYYDDNKISYISHMRCYIKPYYNKEGPSGWKFTLHSDGVIYPV